MDIVTIFTNPEVLKTKTEYVDFSVAGTQIEMRDLAKEMAEVMYKHNGVGLAANQVGVNKQMFIMRGAEEIIAVINPRIVWTSDEVVEMEEGCLSFPSILAKVTRPKSIRVRYAGVHGLTDTYTYEGLTARIFQHEYQHLQGETFLQGISDTKLRMLVDKARKKGYHYTVNMLR